MCEHEDQQPVGGLAQIIHVQCGMDGYAVQQGRAPLDDMHRAVLS
jgi:hypothetical protein